MSSRAVLMLVACLVLGGCAAVTVRGSTTTAIPSTSTLADDVISTTTTPPPSTTSTTVPAGPPVAWVAPSGVLVAVTTANGETLEVLTPCGAAEVVSEGEPIYEADVVIDPGHGGPVDTGAVGSNGVQEKEVNLKVSLRAAEILEGRGIAAVLTRTGDYPIPIRTRVEFAHLMRAHALVSIHHNGPAAPASDVPGVEIFVQHESPESQRLGGLVYDATMAALSEFDVEWDRSPDAGVMTVLNTEGEDAYGMVRLPDMPSALVELGYIANPAEAQLYLRPDYVEVAASSVADAVEAFLTTNEEGAPLVDGRIFNPSSGVGRDQCVEPDLELALYPDVIDATVDSGDSGYSFSATVSSPYDSADRYADAFRVVGDDGQVYGIRELTHHHANEQPFTRTLGPIEIPDTVESVYVEARDQVYGWGGETVTVELP